jgi:hypothetical protein
MTLGLNSTLLISDGNKKLPPCPILLLSTNEGVLQVYYFIHKNLPSICRKPSVIESSLGKFFYLDKSSVYVYIDALSWLVSRGNVEKITTTICSMYMIIIKKEEEERYYIISIQYGFL